MSWKDAREEAQRWLDRQQIPRSARGGTVDLTEAARALKFEGEFRIMVLEAARRLLERRKITLIVRNAPAAE